MSWIARRSRSVLLPVPGVPMTYKERRRASRGMRTLWAAVISRPIRTDEDTKNSFYLLDIVRYTYLCMPEGEKPLVGRRDFLKKAGALTGAALGSAVLPEVAAPKDALAAENDILLTYTEAGYGKLPVAARFELRADPTLSEAVAEQVKANPDLQNLATSTTDIARWLLSSLAQGPLSADQSTQFKQALDAFVAQANQITYPIR